MANDLAKSTNKIELWPEYEVEVNEQLLDDFNFIRDLNEAQRTNNLADFVSMLFMIVGGQKVYDEVEAYITKEEGYFSQKRLLEIVEKIGKALPKAGVAVLKR